MEFVEVKGNGNVEVCVGDAIVHTAATMLGAQRWALTHQGCTVAAQNMDGTVVVPSLAVA